MGRPSWRWAAVAALLACLTALPAFAGLLPSSASGPDRSPAELLAAVRGSDRIAWSGYGTSNGTLALPDVSELSTLPELAGGSSRTRVWWRGPTAWRVDSLTAVGESDIAADSTGVWQWESADRRAVRVEGDPSVRLPRATDLVAPVLGRRLARTPGVVPQALPDRRVAGRGAAGLRLVPSDAANTTVQSVDLWVEPRTGLTLRVEVVARGQQRPSLTTTLLDLSLSVPPVERTAFRPPPEASVTVVEAPDVASMIDQFAPYALPDSLAGLPRRERIGGLTGGVATYGDGFTSMVLLPLPRDIGRRVLRGLDPNDTDDQAAVTTPLVTAGVVRVPHRGGWFLVAGTVPRPLLDTALAAVLADPPARLR